LDLGQSLPSKRAIGEPMSAVLLGRDKRNKRLPFGPTVRGTTSGYFR